MTTADAVRERALTLARETTDRDEALRDLRAFSGDRRVSVVRARQQLVAWLDSETDRPTRCGRSSCWTSCSTACRR